MYKRLSLSIVFIIMTFLLLSCEISTRPITGGNTTTYAELTDGNYRGVTGYNQNRILYDITISTNAISQIKTVKLKAYHIDIANNTFFPEPYLWLEGEYSTLDYYSDYPDPIEPRRLYNWPISHFEFTQNKIDDQTLNPSNFNSDFTYSLTNTPNANDDKWEIVYKATISSNVNFCKIQNSTSNFRPFSSWMINLVLTKTTF